VRGYHFCIYACKVDEAAEVVIKPLTEAVHKTAKKRFKNKVAIYSSH